MNSCKSIPKSKISGVERIIVIGDIHGDWMALKSALKIAGITNHKNQWLGGRTHLVQVGDLIDRAVRGDAEAVAAAGDEKSESRIINHLIDLKQQALQAGGDVHILLGNHELMNVMGDFRYVSPMGRTDFDGDRKTAFKPGGKVAQKLACNANSVVQIGSWVFSHAGVTSKISERYTVDQVNEHIREYLLGNNTSMDNNHPLMDIFWHRRYGDESSCPLVHEALANWKARNMAVGHTVQSNGINNMCRRALWKVDIGMSDAFSDGSKAKNPVEVLEIINDTEVNILRGKK